MRGENNENAFSVKLKFYSVTNNNEEVYFHFL